MLFPCNQVTVQKPLALDTDRKASAMSNVEWELSKENIQPRRKGRKPETLKEVHVVNQVVDKDKIDEKLRYVARVYHEPMGDAQGYCQNEFPDDSPRFIARQWGHLFDHSCKYNTLQL